MRIHKHYTWPELVAEATQPTRWTRTIHSESDNYSFSKTHSYAESLDLLTMGWKDGADKIEHGLQTIGATHNAPCFTLDVAGAFPHAPLAAAGDPACMFTSGDETRPRPCLTLVCGFCCNANVSAQSIHLNGLALCSVIDSLEQTGTRVELIAEARSNGNGDFGVSVVVKELQQPLDLYRIAYVFCHASMLRRTWFRIAERYMPNDFGPSYGHATTADPAKFPPGSVFIPGPQNVSGLDAAKTRITALIEKTQAE